MLPTPPRSAARARLLGLTALWLTGLLGLSGCAGDGESDHEEGPVGQWVSGLTVGGAGGCSTSIVAGLSRQLIEEINCLSPNSLVDFRGSGISVGSGVHPFLEPPAAQKLKAAVAARGGTIHVNSAFRTLAQQYLLKKWEGSCGIQIAASPGSSNHETGLALDVSDYDTWRSALESHSWDWYGSGDRVHYTYVGSGARDLRGNSVKAFQRLWNKNHPGDRIAEDGDYGPATESRLRQSPVDGFATHGCSAPPPPPPPPPPADIPDFRGELKSATGPMALVSGQGGEVVIRVKNTGDKTWNANTRIGTTVERDRESDFATADWIAPHRPTAVKDATCAPGATCEFRFLMVAPAVTTATTYVEHFGVVQEGRTWFGGLGGEAIALTVAVTPAPVDEPPPPPVMAPPSVEPEEPPPTEPAEPTLPAAPAGQDTPEPVDPAPATATPGEPAVPPGTQHEVPGAAPAPQSGELTGGCSALPGAPATVPAWLLLGLPLLLVRSRRSR